MKKNGTFLKKQMLLCLTLTAPAVFCVAQGPYAPAAGNPGSTAVSADSAIIKSWATGISVQRGLIQISDPTASFNGSNYASFGTAANALGKAKGNSFNVVSLGDGGTAELTFDRPVANGAGPDFVIFENSFSDTFLELALVEVSSDGKRFVQFPAVSLTPVTEQLSGIGQIDPTNIHNLAGKYRQGFGTPFDLNDIKDSSGIDLNNIRFIRVRDVTGSINSNYASYDSKGNIINDPYPSAFHSGGFDLDGIGIINAGQAYNLATFDELQMAGDSYWDGADLSGGFSSGLAFFPNEYNQAWYSWSGYAYSNMRNDSTAGWMNQYSAITGGGIHAPDTGGTNYVLAYIGYQQYPVTFKDNGCHVVSGMYVTNSAYAYWSMKDGDMFSKKFGGENGTDPDYFKLLVWGQKADSSFTDTIEFFLADFRFSDNSKDYILNSWKWLDLLKLGPVINLQFGLQSSDNGDWGMNTPSYFCIDNLTVLPADKLIQFSPIADVHVNVNSEPVNIQLNSAFTAYNAANISYQVNSNSNTALVQTALTNNLLSLNFTPETTGEANIEIIAAFADELENLTFKVVVNEAANVSPALANKANAWPNPFKNSLTVNCLPGSQIQLLDISGRTLLKQKTNSGQTQLDVSALPKSVYFIKIENGANHQVIKVLNQ